MLRRHAEHARRDNVFVQFYPMLLEAAHITLGDAAAEPSGARLALNGLDPVLFADGREELGKAEIAAHHDGREYRFVSEPNRARFAAEPARFATAERAATSPVPSPPHARR